METILFVALLVMTIAALVGGAAARQYYVLERTWRVKAGELKSQMSYQIEQALARGRSEAADDRAALRQHIRELGDQVQTLNEEVEARKKKMAVAREVLDEDGDLGVSYEIEDDQKAEG